MAPEGGRTGIVTTEVVFEIVESIRDRRGATLAEIADDVDRSKSTVYAHLVTLVDLGYVRNEDGEYQAGLKFLDLGTYSRSTYEVYRVARPKLKRLAEETDERAQLMVERDGRGIYVCREGGSRAIPAEIRLGRPRYLHMSSAGKAILAHLPRERIDGIIERWGLPTKTDHTVVERDRLEEELEAIRDRGFAVNRQESLQGVWAVGAPVRKGSDVLGAVSVSGPAHRLQEGGEIKPDVGNDVLSYAEEIEIGLNLS